MSNSFGRIERRIQLYFEPESCHKQQKADSVNLWEFFLKL